MGSGRLKAAAIPGAGALVMGLAILFTGLGNVGQSNAEISELAYYVSVFAVALERSFFVHTSIIYFNSCLKSECSSCTP
jgi:hypothetical protein